MSHESNRSSNHQKSGKSHPNFYSKYGGNPFRHPPRSECRRSGRVLYPDFGAPMSSPDDSDFAEMMRAVMSCGSSPAAMICMPPSALADVLSFFSESMGEPPLNFTVICDTHAQSEEMVQRAVRAGERLRELVPDIGLPGVVAQCFLAIDEIYEIAREENADAEVTELTLVVELCRQNPADIIIGVGEQSKQLVAKLKARALEMYPDHAENFLTPDVLNATVAQYDLADDPDADIIAALTHLSNR